MTANRYQRSQRGCVNIDGVTLISCSVLLSQQEALLEDLRTDIPVHFNFLFSDSHVEVISGKQEGEISGISRSLESMCVRAALKCMLGKPLS